MAAWPASLLPTPTPPTPPPLPHFHPDLGNPRVPHTVPAHYLAYVDQLPASSIDKYKIIGSIGGGSFGNLYEVRVRRGRQSHRWALKKKNREPMEYISNSERREIHALRTIGKHVNVIELLDIVAEPGMLSPVFEFCITDLDRTIRSSVEITKQEKISMLKMILSGLTEIHAKKFIHRDLKPSNILINRKGIIKIADFGSAIQRDFEFHFNSKIVTLAYRAPELLLGDVDYTQKIDVWGVGITTGEMWFRHYMLQGNTEFEILRTIFHYCGYPTKEEWPEMRSLPEYSTVRGRFKHLRCDEAAEKFALVLSEDDIDGIDFMLRSLELNPKKRYSAHQLLTHRFLEGAGDNVRNLLQKPGLYRFR